MKKLILLISILALTLGLFAAEVVIGTGTATQRFPLGSYFGFERSAALYTAAEIGAQNTRISAVSWYSELATTAAVPTKIYLKSTPAYTLIPNTWDNVASGATLVYDQTPNGLVAGGWNLFTFTSAFDLDMGENLMILVERNFGGGGAGVPGGQSNGGKIYSTISPGPAHLTWGKDTSPPIVNGAAAANRPNVTLSYESYTSDSAPNPALVFSPANAAIEVQTNATLNWGSGGGAPAGYSLYFGTDNPPTNLVNGTDLGNVITYNPGALNRSTSYYWQVIPYNANGAATGCPVWSFSTIPEGLVMIGDGALSTLKLPLNSNYGYNYSQVLYLQPEIDMSGQRIEKLYYHWNGYEAGTNLKNWTIFMGHTDKTDFTSTTDWIPVENMVQVFSGEVNLPATPGWVEITLTLPFAYNNTDNLVIAVNETSPGYNNSLANFYGTSSTSYRGLRLQNDSTVYNPAAPGTGTRVLGFANIRMQFADLPSSPIIYVNPAAWDFGNQMINTTHTKNFVISNTGAGSLELNNLWVDGNSFALAEPFASPAPISLQMGNSFSFDVNYLPTSVGDHTTTINISTNLGDTLIQLNGSAYDPTITLLPHSENFDGAWIGNPAAPTGWTVVNADNDGYTWRQGNNYISPTVSVPHAAVGMGNNNDWLISPPIQLSADSRLKWWDKVESATRVNTYTVLVSTTDSAIASFTTELATFNCANTVWNQQSLSLIDFTGSTVYLAFHQTVSPSSSYGFGIDDVLLEEIPALAILSYSPSSIDFGSTQVNNPSAYTDVLISNIGGNILNLSADDIDLITASTPQFEYSTANFPVALAAGESVSIPVRFAPTAVGSFNGTLQITYDADFYEIALSGAAISATALMESFEGDIFPPAGWSLYNGGDANTWGIVASPRTGLNAAGIQYDSSTAHDDWLITPALAVTADETYFGFWAKNGSASWLEQFNVKLSTTTNEIASFTTTLASAVEPGATYTQYGYELDGYIGQNVYIAVQAISMDQLSLYLDDFVGPSVFSAPIAPEAVYIAAPINGATDLPKAGFDFMWRAALTGGIPSSYSVYVASSEENIFDEYVFNDVLNTTFNPVTEGLMNFNFADRWFWTVEAVNDYGSAIPDQVFQFQIEADPTITSLPWNESFEGASFPPQGWSRLDADQDVQNWFHFNAEASAHSGIYSAASASWLSATGALTPDNWLITPPVAIPTTGEYLFEYYVGAQDPDYPDEHYALYISSTGTAVEDFSLLQEETLVDGDWHYRSQNLMDFPGETVHFAFRHFNCSDVFYMKIDDVAVREVPQIPIFSYNPVAWDFGNTHTMSPATPKNFVLSNTGVGSITINSADIVLNDPEGNFVLNAQNLPAYLIGTDTYSFNVQFIPQSAGAKTASISIQDNITRALHSILLTGEAVAEPIASILGLQGDIEAPNNVRLQWASIYGNPSNPGYLHWDDSIFRSAVGAGQNSYNVAAKYNTEVMAQAAGMELWNVMIHISAEPQTVDTLKVWFGVDSDPAPYTLVHEQALSGLSIGWNNIQLDNSISLSGSEALFVGYHVSGITNAFPASTDGIAPVNGLGNLVDLGGWMTLVDAGITQGNWMIHPNFVIPAMMSARPELAQASPVARNHTDLDLRNNPIEARRHAHADRYLRGFNIYRDSQQINSSIVAAYDYLDLELAAGLYDYAVQSVHYSGNGNISASIPVNILPPAAPINLPFIEDWASASHTANMWTAGSSNWLISDHGGLYSPSMSFAWNPQAVDYDIPLTSYYFNGIGIDSIKLRFDIALDNYSTDAENSMSVDVWDGNMWNTIETFSSLDHNGAGWDFISTAFYDISAYAADREFRIRFRAHGEDSFEINHWHIDNISLGEMMVPETPTNLAITPNPTNNTMTLSWRAVPNADWYGVYVGTDPNDLSYLGWTQLTYVSIPAHTKGFFKVSAGAGPYPNMNTRIAPPAMSKP